jgi:hypothetical protein
VSGLSGAHNAEGARDDPDRVPQGTRESLNLTTLTSSAFG